jgi:hypothetical protein
MLGQPCIGQKPLVKVKVEWMGIPAQIRLEVADLCIALHAFLNVKAGLKYLYLLLELIDAFLQLPEFAGNLYPALAVGLLPADIRAVFALAELRE